MPSEWASGAGAEHGLRRAAGLGAVGLGVGPELDRDPDDLRPALALEQRGDGAVDAAGHGDERRGSAGRRVPGSAVDEAAAPERAVQGVGGELGGVPLGRGEAAERGVDVVDPEPRRLEHRGAVDHFGHGRRGGARRPAALGVEADCARSARPRR